jgi:hypothetical protein
MDGKAGAEKLISEVLQNPALLQVARVGPKPTDEPGDKT